MSRDCCKARFSKCFHPPYQNEKLAFSNSSNTKNLFEKLCFCDGLVWMVDLSNEAVISKSSGVYVVLTGPNNDNLTIV